MYIAVILALFLSFSIYLILGFSLSKKTKNIGDLMPLVFGHLSAVKDSNEFSSTTVATTISLATVIIAYFEMVPFLGVWLLWTVVTTAIGLILMTIFAKKIWLKMSDYDHRPTLHEFLGTEFNSNTVSLVGSICTSLGFLLIFALELTVGSRFLAGLIPEIPQYITVIILCAIGFTYTALGGFRAVIRTDVIQMRFIWLLLIALSGYYITNILINGGINLNLSKIPPNVINFSWRENLTSFLIGIFIMNVPTHISNMGIWQRIAASENPEMVVKGLWSSVAGATISWAVFVFLACFSFTITQPKQGENILITVLNIIGQNFIGKVVVFFAVLGLYGAMLSTASTLLIVVSHTIYEDIISKYGKKSLKDRLNQDTELKISRIILVASAIGSTLLVELLRVGGFSIADLVFAIYGGQLTLFPVILFALLLNKEKLSSLVLYANTAIILGFISGWGSAIIGKILNNGNLIFLAPAFGIGTSFFILSLGLIIKK